MNNSEILFNNDNKNNHLSKDRNPFSHDLLPFMKCRRYLIMLGSFLIVVVTIHNALWESTGINCCIHMLFFECIIPRVHVAVFFFPVRFFLSIVNLIFFLCANFYTHFGLQSSLNGPASSLPDTTGRSFAASFSSQSGAASPGTFQGLHNIHGSFNVPSMPGTLASRNSTVNNIHSVGVQQPTGSLSGGRFASNNLPVGLSQLSHGSSHGHSGVTNREGISVVGNPGYGSNTTGIAGSISGILPASSGIGNPNDVSGLGVSQILGYAGPMITRPGGTMVAGGNIGRSLSTG
ncbi:hypothetical protein SADUNF_Sadunf17G0065900 [Salix dunnii]|uniref:Uncharacterized protein n=1 Tax=Salix dunnii TaxID=1413687 RepID=A0A835MJV1_9ROSI|nr:hypothetical protein SADUNF_Sadunf17G0065900 [Salix dunnii]